MEKLQRYNQKLLAVIGTLVLVFLFIGFLSFLYFEVVDYSYVRYPGDGQTYVSNEVADSLLQENLRKHIISFRDVDRADSINQVYMIPVSQTDLEHPEDIYKDLYGLRNSLKDYEPYPSYFGLYNNVLIYYAKTDSILPIFDQRISINYIFKERINNQVYILLKGCKQDSNKDGKLNEDDLQSLYVFNVSKMETNSIEIPDTDFMKFQIIDNTNELVLIYGVDRDKDGLFNDQNEPRILKKYNLLDQSLTDIIDKNLINKLQKTLDGRQ